MQITALAANWLAAVGHKRKLAEAPECGHLRLALYKPDQYNMRHSLLKLGCVLRKPTQSAWLATLVIASIATYSTQSSAYDPLNREEYLAKIKQAEALYKDKCEKVAGIKTYKTVPEVEGVLLIKIRPDRTDRELSDPMWPGAAFGEEFRGESYVKSFLGYEHSSSADGSPVTPTHRGYINTDKRLGGLPGYRWVEVPDPKDGQRYRYSARYDEPWQTDKNYLKGYIRFNLDKTPSPSKTPPRYAVTFEDHVIPEERALWVASSTVKVLDLKTSEVLGEMTRYAMSYIHAPRQSMPWLNHQVCPGTYGSSGTTTRQFVDQILIPKREQ